jgi:membrane protein implicated in regulation of membrane protease activity
MLTLYVICLLVGLVFAVISFVFSGAFEADIDTSADMGMHMDAHGDIVGGDAGIGEVHFPLFSPIVIACFITAFGAGGIIGLKLFAFAPTISLLVATGSGILVGLLAGYVVMKIYQKVQTNSVTIAKSLIGNLAEVTEPIPASGVGQISFSGKAGRVSGPARGEENKDIKRHAMVTITRCVGGLYYVREHVDEKLRNVPTTTEDR